MWPADRQIHSGQLHSALGLHLGHHQHHGFTHSLLCCLQPGQPAGQAAAGGLSGGGERYGGGAGNGKGYFGEDIKEGFRQEEKNQKGAKKSTLEGKLA